MVDAAAACSCRVLGGSLRVQPPCSSRWSRSRLCGMPAAEQVELEVAGQPLTISSPGKVWFAERGETKLDLVEDVLAVEEPLLRAIGGRPILMERYPDGAAGKPFFQ